VGKDDVLIVISNSGGNAVPVEMAQEAQLRGIPVNAVTSLSYSREISARQAGGKKRYEIADVVLEQLHSLRGRGRQPTGCSPVGPALVHSRRCGPTARARGRGRGAAGWQDQAPCPSSGAGTAMPCTLRARR
jgi:hypothetical protein